MLVQNSFCSLFLQLEEQHHRIPAIIRDIQVGRTYIIGSEGSVTALRTFDVFFYSSWYGPVVNWYNFGKEKEFNSENVKRDLEEQRRANQHRHLYDYLVSWVLWFGLVNNWGKPKQENRPSWSQVTANNSSAVSRSTVVKPLQNFEWL